MKKILVTGGAGFIGTNLLKSIDQREYNLFSIDNYCIGSKENHIEGVEYLNDNILNINNYSIKFDIIYHLAALSRIQPSFENPMQTFDYNTKGTMELLEYAKKQDSKLIYGGSSSRHHDPSISPYAMTKYLGEEIIKLYNKCYSMNNHIVRFYNVYGDYEILHGKWAAVIGKWRYQIKRNIPITIVGDGNQKRDFTHVDDIVDGLVKISETKSNNFIWELGSGTNYTLNEVYSFFKKKFNCKCVYIKDQSGNYRETLRENNLALTELDWKPKGDLEKYILSL
jgi:UDP-glucose 4-epimerase